MVELLANSGGRRLLDRALDEGAVGGHTKLLLVVMCRRGNKSRVCFMSIGRMSGETGISSSSVKRHLKELVSLGIIELVATSTDAFRPRRYRLYPHGGPGDPPGGSLWTAGPAHAGPRNPNPNPKRNPAPVDHPGAEARSGSSRQLGSITSDLIAKVKKPRG
jgi:DNA-binding transcriptional ArsR family regulator